MPLGINFYDEERLQGRNVANANAFNIVSPGIVEDGLVLHLDAGNRVSYPASGTVWYDLTDNRNNGTLTNGPTFSLSNGGAIDFDGTNDSINCGDILNFAGQDITFESWIYITSFSTNQSGQGPVIFYKGSANVSGYYYQLGQDGSSFFVTNQSGTRQFTLTAANSFVVSNWHYVCITRIGSAVKIYINGVDATSTPASHSNPTTNSVNFLIAAYSTSIYSNIDVAVFKSYNRALTPVEVDQNFNATRARFGV